RELGPVRVRAVGQAALERRFERREAHELVAILDVSIQGRERDAELVGDLLERHALESDLARRFDDRRDRDAWRPADTSGGLADFGGRSGHGDELCEWLLEMASSFCGRPECPGGSLMRSGGGVR